MNQNSRIRIIKRAERERRSEALAAKRPAYVSRISQEKARDAATTITGWISKWQQQKEQSGVPAFLKLSDVSIASEEEPDSD